MPFYPPMIAGQELTADLFTAYQDDFVFKQVTTTRASTTTLADDPELQYPLVANAVYRIDLYLHVASNTAAAIKTNWTYPTGASGLKEAWGADDGVTLDTTSGGTPRQGVHQLNTSVTYGDRQNSNTLQHLLTEGGIVTTLGAGEFALQWAQAASNATGSIVAIGSYMKIRRIA